MNEVFLPSGVVPRAGTVATGSDTSQPVRSCMWISPSTPSLALHPARPSHVQGMQNHYISISLCLNGCVFCCRKIFSYEGKNQNTTESDERQIFSFSEGRKIYNHGISMGMPTLTPPISQSTRTERHGRWPR